MCCEMGEKEMTNENEKMFSGGAQVSGSPAVAPLQSIHPSIFSGGMRGIGGNRKTKTKEETCRVKRGGRKIKKNKKKICSTGSFLTVVAYVIYESR